MNALETLEVNELNQEQKELVDIIGLDAFKSLVQNYGGTNLYIPKMDTLERQKRNKRIRDEYYKGSTLKKLSLKYSLTETQIRSILNDIYIRKSEHVAVGQMSLDDLVV